MAVRKIESVVADLQREVLALREEVEILTAQTATRAAQAERLAGIFTGDAEWAAIHEAIEEARRQPDPDLDHLPPCGSGTQT